MGDMRQLSTTGRSPSCVIEARGVPLRTNGIGIQEAKVPLLSTRVAPLKTLFCRIEDVAYARIYA